MKQKLTRFIIVALLVAAPQLSFAQYFQKLYDVDSSQDWGDNIFLQPDGSYFVKGTFFSSISNWALFTMQISADGNTVLSKHMIQYDTANLYSGDAGETKALQGGGYISPLTIQTPDPVTGYLHSATGLIKYNASGDTIFTKTYTDTSFYFEATGSCAVMPDGGYVLGGLRDLNTPSYYPGLIIRTDSLGDTLWTHTYKIIDTQATTVNNVISLPDGRIVAGAMSTYQVVTGAPFYLSYNLNTPWFLELDSLGNIIKDTLYGSLYMGGGAIYKDMNGGYFHFGYYSTLYTSDPADPENFPTYVAHLDTNFRITWVVPFNYTSAYSRRGIYTVKQLQDSSYIVVGDAQIYNTVGWAAKISSTGTLLWNQIYISDTTKPAYLCAVAEQPGGGLVFTGTTFNDTCPSWHDLLDMWLVSTDSNGYVPPDTTLGVAPSGHATGGVAVYPNPTSGSFTVTSPVLSTGTVMIYNVQGQCIATYVAKGGSTTLQLPAGISAGVYLCRYVPDEGNNIPAVVRLIYQP